MAFAERNAASFFIVFDAVAGSLRKTKHRGGGCLSSGSRAIELNAHAEM